MMRPCKQCSSNDWTFEKLPDFFIEATCQQCIWKVKWESGKLRRKAKARAENLANPKPKEIIEWTMKDGKEYRNGQEMILVGTRYRQVKKVV